MLIANNISKSFSGVPALQNVSLELHPGKVNAIIGENGAGKSTLMKILSGVYADYDGQVIFNDKGVRFRNTKEAQASGIAIIHQDLNLVPDLSIADNIFLGRELTKFGMLDETGMYSQTKDLLKRLHLNVDPAEKVSSLKIGQQQVAEIAKALISNAKVIIMDEPTSAISEQEVEVLFGIIRELRNDNKIIVYISHKLEELFKISDRYIVLRDGRHIESGDKDGMTFNNIVNKMVGRDVPISKKEKKDKHSEVLLSVEKLCYQKLEVSFKLFKGEVLGVFGLMGAGRTELMESLFGLHPGQCTGAISIEGNPVSVKSPADAIAAGLALVPEDRKKDGLVLELDVRANVCLATLGDMQTMGLLTSGKESALTEKSIGDLGIKTSSQQQLVRNLSGGNQQKVVLAKWLATKPKILMLDEPTRGIDISAKNEIYRLIAKLAAGGMGIIIVSSELPEILAVSDRIIVMSEGIITTELSIGEATESKILAHAIPKTI